MLTADVFAMKVPLHFHGAFLPHVRLVVQAPALRHLPSSSSTSSSRPRQQVLRSSLSPRYHACARPGRQPEAGPGLPQPLQPRLCSQQLPPCSVPSLPPNAQLPVWQRSPCAQVGLA